jgi:hypothetical protein
MAEAAFLIDPLGPRVEVIDTEAYPVQANGAQRAKSMTSRVISVP